MLTNVLTSTPLNRDVSVLVCEYAKTGDVVVTFCANLLRLAFRDENHAVSTRIRDFMVQDVIQRHIVEDTLKALGWWEHRYNPDGFVVTEDMGEMFSTQLREF